MAQNNNFKRGILDGIPIGLGYISVAFAFGIMATGAGLSVTEATLISLFNVTSAGQLAAVPIIASHGGFIELALTQLIINLRYALMSVSLSQKSDKTVRIRDRFLISFANTDEVFAVASSKEGRVGRSYLFGLIIMPIFGWTLGTFLGAVSGNVLPAVINSALGIAIYAMLIAPILRDIPSGFTIIICSVAASALFALIRPVPDGEDSENV